MQFTDRITSRGRAFTCILLLIAATALALACSGGGSSYDDSSATATPTATSATTVSATPSHASGTPMPTLEPTATPVPQVDVTPVDPFDVRSAEAINVRDVPATGGNLVTVVFPGETATVLGEAIGEEVEPGDVKWFQVEIMREGAAIQGFLYAAYVVAI